MGISQLHGWLPAKLILSPDMASEQHGSVDNVILPTAVDVREGGRIDVYYGMVTAHMPIPIRQP